MIDSTFDLDGNLSALPKRGEDLGIVSNLFTLHVLSVCLEVSSSAVTLAEGGAVRGEWLPGRRVGLALLRALVAAKDVTRRKVLSAVERGQIIELRYFLAEEEAVKLSTPVCRGHEGVRVHPREQGEDCREHY